jgi:uncharacterized protein YceK
MKLRIAFLAFALAAGGCGSVRVHTKSPQGEPVLMNQAEFAAYVEQVFRHHNSVANDLLFSANSLEDPDSHANLKLLRAEAKMRHACLPLNEAASAAATGGSPGFWTKMSLAGAVPKCEQATRKVESLLLPTLKDHSQ